MGMGRGMRAYTMGVALLVLATACSRDSSAPAGPVASELRLRPSTISLNQLDSTQLVASVLDKNGVLLSGVPVTFESSAPTIVSVSSIGVVTAIGPAGNATVTARALSIAATVPVTVGAVPTQLVLTPAPGVVRQKGTLQLVARLLDKLGTAIPGAAVTYTSSDMTLLVVSPDGIATSIGPAGQVTVTARSGDFVASTAIAITQVPATIRTTPAAARVGRTRSIRVVPQVVDLVGAVIPGITSFVFTSLSPALLTVSTNGTVTSIGTIGTGAIRVAAPEAGLVVEVPVEVLSASSPVGNVVSTVPISGVSYAVAFTNGDSVVSVSYADFTAVVSASSGVFRLVPGSGESYGVTFDLTRNTSYFVTRSGSVRAVNHTNGSTLQLLAIPGEVEVFSVALSTDASQLYVGTALGDILVVDLATRTVRIVAAPGVSALHLTVHPDGRRVYASGNGGLQEIDLVSGQVRAMNVSGGYWQATAITSDGRYLFALSENGILRRHDLTSNTSDDVLISCGGWGIAITPDDRFLYVSCPGLGGVLVLDATTRGQIYRLEGLGDVRRVAMSLDGTIAAVGSTRGVVLIR